MSAPLHGHSRHDLDRVARCFHEAYERLAPEFGYRTREASAAAWENVPQANKDLMCATVQALIADEEIFTPRQRDEVYEAGITDGKASAEHSQAVREGLGLA